MTFLLMLIKNPLGDSKENHGGKAESEMIILGIGECLRGVRLERTNDFILDHIRTTSFGLTLYEAPLGLGGNFKVFIL